MCRILFLCVCVLMMSHAAISQSDSGVTPIPVSTRVMPGEFVLTAQTTIGIANRQPEVAAIAAYLTERLRPATGFSIKTVTSPGATITLSLKASADAILGKEGYTLKSSSSGIAIEANAPNGLFYGVQTLLQLLPPQIESKKQVNETWRIPAVEILDYPRFAWRGLMLDVSRHFFTKEEVKAYIDQMVRYKFNRFHWHLTDDQGWRIEIKSLPQLTKVGAWRVPRTGMFNTMRPPQPGEKSTYGGFYTQEDIKEVIQYAKERYVEIMPEVDVPGHSMAAIASYPELSVTNDTSIRVNPGSSFATWEGSGKFTMHVDNSLDPTDENTYQFLTKVFGEISVLFPFEYIHVGGDECYKGFWERDPGVQAFMKKNKIASGVELQAYFMKRVAKIVEGQKKKMIGWDEILEGGIASNAAVMAWRGVKGGVEATHLKHRVVMSPATDWYIDMMQGDVSTEIPVYGTSRLDNVYKFNLLPPGIDSTYVLGGQANLWTEQIATNAQMQYMTYPRAWAVSETLWSPVRNKNWKNFVGRVEQQFVRLDAAGVNYSRNVYDPIVKITKEGDRYFIEMSTEVEGLDIYYTVDNAMPNQYHPKYTGGKISIPADLYRFRAISYRDGKPVGTPILIRREDFEKRAGK